MGRENWVGIESNPEVLTEYAYKLGVDKSWAFSDVFGFDDEALRAVPSPCVGLIWLYPYSQTEARKRALGASRGAPCQGVWFMKQLVGNACGAVALTHTVMNCMSQVSRSSSGGTFLDSFGSDTQGADAFERGKLFAPALRDLHESLASQGQTDAPAKEADLDFHFVSLVPVDGRLYELDGNNDGPLDLGPIGDGEAAFLRAAVAHCKAAYVAPFPDSHFSMLALGPKPSSDDGSLSSP